MTDKKLTMMMRVVDMVRRERGRLICLIAAFEIPRRAPPSEKHCVFSYYTIFWAIFHVLFVNLIIRFFFLMKKINDNRELSVKNPKIWFTFPLICDIIKRYHYFWR